MSEVGKRARRTHGPRERADRTGPARFWVGTAGALLVPLASGAGATYAMVEMASFAYPAVIKPMIWGSSLAIFTPFSIVYAGLTACEHATWVIVQEVEWKWTTDSTCNHFVHTITSEEMKEIIDGVLAEHGNDVDQAHVSRIEKNASEFVLRRIISREEIVAHLQTEMEPFRRAERLYPLRLTKTLGESTHQVITQRIRIIKDKWTLGALVSSIVCYSLFSGLDRSWQKSESSLGQDGFFISRLFKSLEQQSKARQQRSHEKDSSNQ